LTGAEFIKCIISTTVKITCWEIIHN